MSIYRLPSEPLFSEWAGGATQKSSTETPEFMPSQWLNDDTMGGLFGPLDANSKNAMVQKHRVARLEFWREFLVSQFRMNPVLSNVDPIISVPILAKLLRRKNTIPLGLQDIITSLLEKGIIVPLSTYANRQSETWWSKLVGSVFAAQPKQDDLYVLVPVVKDRIEKLESALKHKPSIMPFAEFERLTNGLSIDLLIPEMHNIVVFEVHGERGVKISANKSSSAQVTDSDRALFHISRSIVKLEAQESHYYTSITTLKKDTVTALKSGNRAHATTLLRRAKMFEAQLEKSSNARDQLLRISASIEEAQTNAEVFNAMTLGAAALKSENSKIGSPDKVDELMDTVSELIEDQEEISQAIGSDRTLSPVDEASLESELAQLLAEDDGLKPKNTKVDAKTEKDDTDKLLEELAQLSVPVAKPSTASPSSSTSEKKLAEAM